MISDAIGEIAALIAALLWACATILYRRLGVQVSPVALNLYKGSVACLLLLFTLLGVEHDWRAVEVYTVLLLLFSGIVGIGVGDTAFFASLNRLGERKTLLIAETLAPPFSIVIAFVFIAERLNIAQVAGIVTTLCGVAWVISERQNRTVHSAGKAGTLLALLAALSQAVGAVLSREALTQSEISPLLSTLIRLIGGTGASFLWIGMTGQAVISPVLKSGRGITIIVFATIMGTYFGIFFQQLSFKHTNAGIALTLISTSSLFVLLFAALSRERLTPRSIIGAIVAVLGVSLIFSKLY